MRKDFKEKYLNMFKMKIKKKVYIILFWMRTSNSVTKEYLENKHCQIERNLTIKSGRMSIMRHYYAQNCQA